MEKNVNSKGNFLPKSLYRFDPLILENFFKIIIIFFLFFENKICSLKCVRYLLCMVWLLNWHLQNLCQFFNQV